jgi:hypothetical protein
MIPVIFIHTGLQEYLFYTLKQATKFNDNVYLIGDINPNLNAINFFNMQEYNQEFDFFEKNYIHLTTTPFNYELFCYKRWFVLKNFMESKKIDVVFYCDSDVLLFSNIEKEWINFNQYDLTLLHRTAPVSSFITYRGITNFCNMLQEIYNNKNSYHYKKIASHYDVRKEFNLPGGVCDMTLFEYFHYNHDLGGGPGRVGEMMGIINDSTYDHNINTSDQDFSMKNGLKNVKIKDGIPYVYNEKLKKDIKFNSLHFQGGSKYFIKMAYEKCN